MSSSDHLEEIRQALEADQISEADRRDLLRQALIYADEVRRLYLSERARADELQDSLDLLRRTDEHRRQLLKGLIGAEERERKRIAGDIHDDSIQVMAAVGLRVHAARRRLVDEEAVRVFEKLEQTVEAAIARLRMLLFQLRPPSLDREGLVAAIDEYIEVTKTTSGPTYHIKSELSEEPPEEIRVLLYRILQEILTNVRKHADATRVDVSLGQKQGSISLHVRDDGKGFPAQDMLPERAGHIGLATVRERVETAGGRARIESTPGQGTLIECLIPIHPI